MVSINVLIITYNQEGVISRALDSVLFQKDYGLKEIVICDDHSTDGNWNVIQSYVKRFPSLVRAYHNESNLGIYGNIQKLISLKGEADLYYILAGDDLLFADYFKKIQLFIEKNDVFNASSKYCIYSDWKLIRPDGISLVVRNNKIKKKVPAFSLRYRLEICSRSLFISRAVIDNFGIIPLDRGVSYSENTFEFQIQRFSEKNYYLPFVGSAYFSQIGVSTKMHSKKQAEEELNMWSSFMKEYSLSMKDQYYTREKIETCKFDIHPNFTTYLKIIKYHIKGFDVKIGFSFRRELFFLKHSFNRLVKLMKR